MNSSSTDRILLLIGLFAIIMVFWGVAAMAAIDMPPSHMDKLKNPEGCAACHAGRGVMGTPMLKEGYASICFRCHGERGRGKSQHNVESVFRKISIHPVFETKGRHRSNERLPETSPQAERHVSCFDCHRAHVSGPGKPLAGVKGYSPGPARMDWASGLRMYEVKRDYELCYLCHSASENLPPGSTNKAIEFDPLNASFHPVEAQGRNNIVPSLRGGLRTTDLIDCGSCHGNNDIVGARGPHGSDYAPLLVAKYRTQDGPESALDYALCYTCHERKSILDDESFKQHALHVVQQNTACHTCHDPHGSTLNLHLIVFNQEVVSPSDVSGGPSYQSTAPGAPQCYLKCHDSDHNINGIGGKPWPY